MIVDGSIQTRGTVRIGRYYGTGTVNQLRDTLKLSMLYFGKRFYINGTAILL